MTPPAEPAEFASWHPKLQRMYHHWRALWPAPDRLPGRQHLDPLRVPDLLPGMWLLDVHRNPFRLRYRLVGTRIVEAIGREVTGQWLEEAHPHLGADASYLGRYRQVAETAIPSRRRGPARLWDHQDYREIENVLYPFASDGKTVDMLLALTVLYWADGHSE